MGLRRLWSRRWQERQIRDYLAALREADAAAVDRLFTADATVHSPLYGDTEARAFYASLFADTERSDIELAHIFFGRGADRAAALFHYQWTLRGGYVVAFDCVDVFRFDPVARAICELTIVYDTGGASGRSGSALRQVHGHVVGGA